MITITLNQIKIHNPCTDGWEKVLKATGGINADFDKPFAVSSILDSNDLGDTLWTLRCLPEHNKLWCEFACWCAMQNIEKIKPYCSADDYDLIVQYLTNQDEDLRSAAWSAADSAACSAACAAARSAAWSATESAARSAAIASWSATESAAWSAAAADSAAESAAWSAAAAAAESAQTSKLREVLDNE